MKKVLVAMSGGVDSAVSAALLTKAGLFCHGVYLKVWSPELEELIGECPWEEDVAAVMAVAEHLGITAEVWDVSKEYFERVVSNFFAEYKAGRTPNPDILCNSTMKFGLLLDRARAEGYDAVATGHYARIVIDTPPARGVVGGGGSVQLLAAVDINKDQSYFLYRLTQEQLRHALFPIGEYTKPQVRAMAKEFELPNAHRKDSQGVCFIGKVPVQAFLKRHLPIKKGQLVTIDGTVVGEHYGAHFVTIGQRSGIGSVGGGAKYFVVAKDIATNTVIVGEGEHAPELFKEEVRIEYVHWISGTPPAFPLTCTARIRYRQPLAACVVSDTPPARGGVGGGGSAFVTFSFPQRAIAPGQSCVLYDGDRVLGGGIIME